MIPIKSYAMRWTIFVFVIFMVVAELDSIRVYQGTTTNFIDAPKVNKRSWSGGGSKPGLYKIKLTQKGYVQFLRYTVPIPDLQQYTFCLWVMSKNFTHAHPLFSYTRNEKERIILVWLEPRDSTLKMSIRQDIVASIPITLLENTWYHICQSWTGIKGEWMVLINGKHRGSQTLPKYAGTYLQGGGDVTVGQDLADFDKGLDDGVEGEIFGFNLVDKAVDLMLDNQDQGTSYDLNIPEFKKMPPVYKSFEEIHKYIKKLPPAADVRVQPIRTKYRHPPPPAPLIKKVVIYRDERRIDDVEKTPVKSLNRLGEDGNPNVIPGSTTISKINQVYNENYSMHSYRKGKDRLQPAKYEIYERNDDDDDDDNFDDKDDNYDINEPEISKTANFGKRRARNNLDVYLLREANRVNPFYVKHLEAPKRKFHFQQLEQPIAERRFSIEAKEVSVTKRSPAERRNLPDFIPVYEIVDEGPLHTRRKRSDSGEVKRDQREIDTGTLGIDKNNFRRLPEFPQNFFEIIKKLKDEEALQQINQYFPQNTTEIKRIVIAPVATTTTMTTTTTSTTTTTTTAATTTTTEKPKDEIFETIEQPVFTSHGASFPNAKDLSNLSPIEISAAESRFAEKLSSQEQEDNTSNDENAGNELVTKSYKSCDMDRGSPISDKRHLLISWADTPVRIYGGAIVAVANNVCGYF